MTSDSLQDWIEVAKMKPVSMKAEVNVGSGCHMSALMSVDS